MSKMCIGIINPQSSMKQKELKDKVEHLSTCSSYRIFSYMPCEESFVKNYVDSKSFFFSFADSNISDNCEMLLLPDSCYFNGETNKLSFYERMVFISCIIENMLQLCDSMDLFIGDSGTNFFEFERININLKDFVKVATEKLNSIDAVDIHFEIRC